MKGRRKIDAVSLPHSGEGVDRSQEPAARPESARVPEAVRRREPAALGEFFEAHFDRLYNLAYRLLGDRALCEDVLQEVFLKIHRAADQLDPQRDPGPWLATLTRNACREQWRRKGSRIDRQSRSLDDESGLSEALPAEAESPERRTLRGERDRAVASALMKLPEALREVVVLRDFHGMAHEEVARVVNERNATVRKRYSRALAELRGFLQGVLG